MSISNDENIHLFEDILYNFPDSLDNNLLLDAFVSILEKRFPAFGNQISSYYPKFCTRIFERGDLVYHCNTCTSDDTCVQCSDCFRYDNHVDHQFFFYVSEGSGGCCDCAELESWNNNFIKHCFLNDSIPQEEATAIFCCSFFNFFLPLFRLCNKKIDEATVSNFISEECFLILLNDEIHSFDDVIDTLLDFFNIDNSKGSKIAQFIDEFGCGIILRGKFESCIEFSNRLKEGTHLDSLVLDKNSISLLYLLISSAAFFIKYIQTHPDAISNQICNNIDFLSLVEISILNEYKHIKIIRKFLQSIITKACISSLNFKHKIGIFIFSNLDEIFSNYFLHDNRESHLNIVHCFIQIFTSFSVIEHLILFNNFYETIFSLLTKFNRLCYSKKYFYLLQFLDFGKLYISERIRNIKLDSIILHQFTDFLISLNLHKIVIFRKLTYDEVYSDNTDLSYTKINLFIFLMNHFYKLSQYILQSCSDDSHINQLFIKIFEIINPEQLNEFNSFYPYQIGIILMSFFIFFTDCRFLNLNSTQISSSDVYKIVKSTIDNILILCMIRVGFWKFNGPYINSFFQLFYSNTASFIFILPNLYMFHILLNNFDTEKFFLLFSTQLDICLLKFTDQKCQINFLSHFLRFLLTILTYDVTLKNDPSLLMSQISCVGEYSALNLFVKHISEFSFIDRAEIGNFIHHHINTFNSIIPTEDDVRLYEPFYFYYSDFEILQSFDYLLQSKLQSFNLELWIKKKKLIIIENDFLSNLQKLFASLFNIVESMSDQCLNDNLFLSYFSIFFLLVTNQELFYSPLAKKIYDTLKDCSSSKLSKDLSKNFLPKIQNNNNETKTLKIIKNVKLSNIHNKLASHFSKAAKIYVQNSVDSKANDDICACCCENLNLKSYGQTITLFESNIFLHDIKKRFHFTYSCYHLLHFDCITQLTKLIISGKTFYRCPICMDIFNFLIEISPQGNFILTKFLDESKLGCKQFADCVLTEISCLNHALQIRTDLLVQKQLNLLHQLLLSSSIKSTRIEASFSKNNIFFVEFPDKYDLLYLSNYKRKCMNCDKYSYNPALCLICGIIICAFSSCCNVNGNGEGWIHSSR